MNCNLLPTDPVVGPLDLGGLLAVAAAGLGTGGGGLLLLHGDGHRGPGCHLA